MCLWWFSGKWLGGHFPRNTVIYVMNSKENAALSQSINTHIHTHTHTHTHTYHDKWMQHIKNEIQYCGLPAKARQQRSSKHL